MPAKVSPIVPPICWKNVRLAVATPIRAALTEFWTTSVKTAKDGPMPRPVMSIQNESTGRSRLGGEVREHEQAEREQEQRAEHQHLVLAGSGDDLARGVALKIRPPTERQEAVARDRGARPADRLEPARQEDDRAEEPERREEHRGHGDREVADPEQGRAARSDPPPATRSRGRRPPMSEPGQDQAADGRVGPLAGLLVGQPDQEQA